MKHSNFVAPRSLAECQFIPSCDPIERPPMRSVSMSPWAVVAVVILVCAAALWGM